MSVLKTPERTGAGRNEGMDPATKNKNIKEFKHTFTLLLLEPGLEVVVRDHLENVVEQKPHAGNGESRKERTNHQSVPREIYPRHWLGFHHFVHGLPNGEICPERISQLVPFRLLTSRRRFGHSVELRHHRGDRKRVKQHRVDQRVDCAEGEKFPLVDVLERHVFHLQSHQSLRETYMTSQIHAATTTSFIP